MRSLRAATLLLFALSAHAHDAWFEPVLTKTDAGGVAELKLMLGERLAPEETLPFESARVAGIWMATGDDLRDLHGDAAAMAGLITLGNAAPAMIAVERIPFDVSLDAERFNTYLEDEGHFGAVRARMASGGYAAPARERVTRHLKTFVGALDQSFLHRFGTRLEILPLAVPAPGQPLRVSVILDGRALRNARVAVFGRGADGGKWQKMVRTDKGGEARVVISGAGLVLVRTTHIEACDHCDVDYRSDWAALTFVVP